jgi:TolB-like protein/class 3 adenylate cyclase/Tfp pilus assembly protein PilF
MAEKDFKRKLAAILSADVEGYSRLMDDDEEATVRTLTAYRSAINDLVQQYRGRVVDNPGDNILAEFASVVDAVNCAVEIQRELAERNAEMPHNRKMEFRIGVNLGDVIEEEGRIYGDGVNIAARVEAMAKAGGICITGRAYDQVANKLGLEYENLGEHQVKNITMPIRVFRVLSFPGAAAHRVVQAKDATGRRWRKITLSMAAVGVVAVVVLGIWQFYMRRPTVEPASVEKMAFPLPDKPSIAVLPFANLSGDAEQDYLSDGISEQIITSLSKIPHLFVIARNSTFTYKGKPVKVQQVAEDLGIRYVLEGSVQLSGEKLRITAQLIDAIPGNHLWAEHYDRDLKDIFVLQDEITSKIITSLQITLTEGEYARMVGSGTSDLKALEYFWLGEHHLLYKNFTKEDCNMARQFFEKAVELDPKFATAWAGLGFAHMYGGSFKRAEQCAQKALSIDDANDKAYCLLGMLHYYQRDFDQAIAYIKKAVALSPNDFWWVHTLGFMMLCTGRYEDAIPLLKKALRLSPNSGLNALGVLGEAYYHLKQYNEGIAALKKCIVLNPQYIYPYLHLTAIYSELGQDEEAKHYAEQVLRIDPEFSVEGFWKLWPAKIQTEVERTNRAWRKAGLK